MAADEEGTLARLKALRREFIDPTTSAHHGRIVKLMGDGALVEFASVVDAVRWRCHGCGADLAAHARSAAASPSPPKTDSWFE
jgi:class 3 adenylate cyclase